MVYKKSQKIKLFLFDFTGVVVSGGHFWMAKKMGRRFRRDPKELYAVFYTKYFNLLAVKKVTEKESWTKPIAELRLPLGWQEARKIYLDSHKLKTQVVKLADTLRSQGYRVVLLSKNHRPYLEHEKKQFHLKKHFEVIINTQDLNLPKMSPATLQYVLKRFKVKPGEIIYIDDQEANLTPAAKNGVHTILFTTFPEVQRKIKMLLR